MFGRLCCVSQSSTFCTLALAWIIDGTWGIRRSSFVNCQWKSSVISQRFGRNVFSGIKFRILKPLRRFTRNVPWFQAECHQLIVLISLEWSRTCCTDSFTACVQIPLRWFFGSTRTLISISPVSGWKLWKRTYPMRSFSCRIMNNWFDSLFTSSWRICKSSSFVWGISLRNLRNCGFECQAEIFSASSCSIFVSVLGVLGFSNENQISVFCIIWKYR